MVAIVLAAGDSSRMGTPKALLSFENSTFIEVVLAKLQKTNYKKVIIVLGRHYDFISRSIPNIREYSVLRNHNPEQGQLSSLKLALREVNDEAEGALIVLVDHPLVSELTYQKIYERARKEPDSIIIPVYEDRKGHPVYFGKKFFAALSQAPLDKGARYVVHSNKSSVIEISVEDPGIITDIDTREQYNSIT